MSILANEVIVLDTEGCNIVPSSECNGKNSLSYNVGWSSIRPKDGAVLCERSYVVDEIFNDEQDRMQSAYYANKIPQYREGIANGEYQVASFFDVMNEIANYCKNHNVVAIVAHNARYDCQALNATAKWLTERFCYALPNLEIWDSMMMARSIFGKRPSYKKFCEANGYLTKQGRPQMKAEVLYRFLTKNCDFIEEHTALADVRIEREIVLACYKAHKKMKRVLYHKREVA